MCFDPSIVTVKQSSKNVSGQRTKKHCKIYDGLLPANVHREPSLQRGLMNAQLQNFQHYNKSFNNWSLETQLFCFPRISGLNDHRGGAGNFSLVGQTRCVAGVLEGVFVLKMKAKCGTSTKTLVFQNALYFKARTEESVILLVCLKKN